MGTQKNRLTETILLSTHNKGFKRQITILEHAKRRLSRALYKDSIQEKWQLCPTFITHFKQLFNIFILF